MVGQPSTAARTRWSTAGRTDPHRPDRGRPCIVRRASLSAFRQSAEAMRITCDARFERCDGGDPRPLIASRVLAYAPIHRHPPVAHLHPTCHDGSAAPSPVTQFGDRPAEDGAHTLDASVVHVIGGKAMSGQLTTMPAPRIASRGLAQGLRWALWLLPLHALLLLWGTRKRQPSPSTQFADWAAFVSTDEFRWAHLLASIGVDDGGHRHGRPDGDHRPAGCAARPQRARPGAASERQLPDVERVRTRSVRSAGDRCAARRAATDRAEHVQRDIRPHGVRGATHRPRAPLGLHVRHRLGPGRYTRSAALGRPPVHA
jgi:hypothetical protein